jgi:hypothetical protein
LRGYLGDIMRIAGVRSGYIDVDAPNASSIQKISKEDFERVWRSGLIIRVVSCPDINFEI